MHFISLQNSISPSKSSMLRVTISNQPYPEVAYSSYAVKLLIYVGITDKEMGWLTFIRTAQVKAAAAAAYPPMNLNSQNQHSKILGQQYPRNCEEKGATYVVRSDLKIMAKAWSLTSGARELKSALLVPETSCWTCARGTLGSRIMRSF